MKKKLMYALVLFLSMAVIPLCASATVGENTHREPPKRIIQAATPYTEDKLTEKAPADDIDEYSDFKIYDTSSEKTVTVSNMDFLIGGTAAEVPQSFEKEAIKAQAVAAYTYYARQRKISRDEGNDYDFSADLSKGEKYVTDELLRERCRDNYDNVYKIYEKAAKEVSNELLTYNGDIALTVFYAISSGVTEASENVFASRVDYLVPVASPYDTLAPGYKTEESFTQDEVSEILTTELKIKDLYDNPYEWFGENKKTSSGTVSNIKICSQDFTGLDVRSAFGLRSADFDIVYNGEQFIFTVRGHGHNVGMSQYGANYMAQQGADYKQILLHYYPGTEISKS